ncbi:MAG: hypothetical protein ACI4CE_07365 [Methanomethylophilus alvi]
MKTILFATGPNLNECFEFDFNQIGRILPEHLPDGTPVFRIEYYDSKDSYEKFAYVLPDLKIVTK